MDTQPRHVTVAGPCGLCTQAAGAWERGPYEQLAALAVSADMRSQHGHMLLRGRYLQRQKMIMLGGPQGRRPRTRTAQPGQMTHMTPPRLNVPSNTMPLRVR